MNPLIASKVMAVNQYAADAVYKYAALTELIGTAGIYVVAVYMQKPQPEVRVALGSINAVEIDEVRGYLSEWLQMRFGGLEVNYWQSKAEKVACSEDRLYFTARIRLRVTAPTY